MTKPAKAQSFISRNLVTIVMVPTIIALHFGWSAMQKNRTLVKEHEEIDLPIVTFYKYALKRLSGGTEASAKAVKVDSS